jgi:drug/metabolite transporter (DMT)-like permease
VSSSSSPPVRAIGAALGAALLFGLSAPAAKVLVGDGTAPLLLAGLLYLGSGFGLLIVDVVQRARRIDVAPIPRDGRGRFALSVVVGGAIAPALLMVGLARTTSSTASLLLNLEGVFTALIAWLVVREHTDRRIVLGFGAIAAGGLVLAFDVGGRFTLSPGAIFVAAACLGWAVDNNLTQAVSSADPVRLGMTKGLVAGAANTALALATGAPLPSWATIAAILVVGFLGYGASVVFFVTALRGLGTARTGAYFSTAPFVGAVASLALLGDSFTTRLVVAGALMAVGTALHVFERHAHEHVHEELVHAHEHVHDEHHQHEHPPGVDPRAPHAHEHRHERLVHTHAHAPDLHHRHAH